MCLLCTRNETPVFETDLKIRVWFSPRIYKDMKLEIPEPVIEGFNNSVPV